VAKLALAEPRAIVLAQATIADHLVGAGAVTAKDRAQRGGRDLRVPCEECIAQSDPRLRAELASRKRRVVGPWSFEVREVRPQALNDSLGEVPVRGDLAAEDRKQRRCTGVVVYP